MRIWFLPQEAQNLAMAIKCTAMTFRTKTCFVTYQEDFPRLRDLLDENATQVVQHIIETLDEGPSKECHMYGLYHHHINDDIQRATGIDDFEQLIIFIEIFCFMSDSVNRIIKILNPGLISNSIPWFNGNDILELKKLN